MSTDREIVRRALYDAIEWQEGLEDAQRNTEWAGQAREQANQYRAVLKRRYGGVGKSKLDNMLANATLMSVDDIRAEHSKGRK